MKNKLDIQEIHRNFVSVHGMICKIHYSTMKIEKYSFGTGDRFGMQGEAQLTAIMKANDDGIPLVPVWNKSNREHKTIGSLPFDVREEADRAVKRLGWKGSYYVDADHINLGNVDPFLEGSDFFTIDVADSIGEPAAHDEIKAFVDRNRNYTGHLAIPGIEREFEITEELLGNIAVQYLSAVKKASEIYHYIVRRKGEGNFIAEVSMDEVDNPQTPIDLFFILSGLAAEGVPVQTIAPKFTGRFNKGVDYEGDLGSFRREFEEDLLVIDFAVKEFGLPENLKLSVHSGSDKFSIYPVMGELIRKYDKGIHVKTAGTTWLEEVIGLALAEGKALDMARLIYRSAYERKEELTGPYATVIDIKDALLPSPDEVDGWTGSLFADSLRHIPGHSDYNPSFRQLIHVGYKVAAELGKDYLTLIRENRELVAKQVSENLMDRHIKRLFTL